MTVLLFIARWAWLFIIAIILIIAYIIWFLEVWNDVLDCFRIFSHPLEHLDFSSVIFIAIHVLIPIIASFIYFAWDKNIF